MGQLWSYLISSDGEICSNGCPKHVYQHRRHQYATQVFTSKIIMRSTSNGYSHQSSCFKENTKITAPGPS